MPVLHIEHPVKDFDTWRSAFGGFAHARTAGGVLGYRIHRPIDDPRYVLIDLDFTEQDQAERFLHMLRTQVWPSASVLDGEPQTRLLNKVEDSGA